MPMPKAGGTCSWNPRLRDPGCRPEKTDSSTCCQRGRPRSPITLPVVPADVCHPPSWTTTSRARRACRWPPERSPSIVDKSQQAVSEVCTVGSVRSRTSTAAMPRIAPARSPHQIPGSLLRERSHRLLSLLCEFVPRARAAEERAPCPWVHPFLDPQKKNSTQNENTGVVQN